MARPFTVVDKAKNGRTLAKQVDVSNRELTHDILTKLDATDRDEISGSLYTVKRNVIVKDWFDVSVLKEKYPYDYANYKNKGIIKKIEYNSLTFTENVRKVANG